MTKNEAVKAEIEKIRMGWEGRYYASQFSYKDYAEWLEERLAYARLNLCNLGIASSLRVSVDLLVPPGEIQLRDRSGRILSRVYNIGQPQLPDHLL